MVSFQGLWAFYKGERRMKNQTGQTGFVRSQPDFLRRVTLPQRATVLFRHMNFPPCSVNFLRRVCGLFITICAAFIMLTGCGGNSDGVQAVAPALEPEVVHGMGMEDHTPPASVPADNDENQDTVPDTSATVPDESYGNNAETYDNDADIYDDSWDINKDLYDDPAYRETFDGASGDENAYGDEDYPEHFPPNYGIHGSYEDVHGATMDTPADNNDGNGGLFSSGNGGLFSSGNGGMSSADDDASGGFTHAQTVGQRHNAQHEVIIFASSSLRKTLTPLAQSFERLEPDVKIICVFGSSGELFAQIREGAECDVFIPADASMMDKMDGDFIGDRSRNPDNLNCVLPGSRLNLLENRVVLTVPTGNPAALTGFYQLAQLLRSGYVRLAMGSPDSAVGRYAEEILAYYHISGNDGRTCISYGTGAEEVTAQVVQGTADCGIVYATDAYAVKTGIVAEATDRMCGQVIYPAAVLNRGDSPEWAREFLSYLCGEDAKHMFEDSGFIYLPGREEVSGDISGETPEESMSEEVPE